MIDEPGYARADRGIDYSGCKIHLAPTHIRADVIDRFRSTYGPGSGMRIIHLAGDDLVNTNSSQGCLMRRGTGEGAHWFAARDERLGDRFACLSACTRDEDHRRTEFSHARCA